MSERTWDLVGGVAAILYFVLTMTGWFLWGTQGGQSITGMFGAGGIPELDAPATEVAQFYTDHQRAAQAGFVFFSLALVPYYIFLGRLRAILGAAEGSQQTGTSIYSLGATVGAVLPVLYLTAFWVMAFRPGDVSPEITQLMQDVCMLTGPAGAMGWVVMFIGIAAVVLTSGGLPRWLGQLAIPVGICQLLYIGQGFFDHGAFDGIDGSLGAIVPFLTYLLWINACGVVLVRRGRSASPEHASPATAGRVPTATTS